MRSRFTGFLLRAVLVFQLAAGMPLPMAHAAILLGHEASGRDEQHCPEHASLEPTSQTPTAAVKPHDCCRSVGCQCHCAYTPSICRETVVGVVPASAHLLPSDVARMAAVGPDPRFRPPII